MPSGDAVLREAHAWQEQVFGELTVGWSRLRREEFHAAMTDLVRRSYLTEVEPQDGDRSGVAGSADPTSGTVVTAGDDWLDAVEAAEWVGCSVWTIRRWVRDGKLSAWKRVASGTDGRRAVKSFVRRSELDEKFRLDSQAEHVNRIREGAAPFSDGQKESLRQVLSEHVLEHANGRSQVSRQHLPVEEVEGSRVRIEARSASNMAQGARRIGSVKRKRQGPDDA
jgi:excisionase family DNA binding protein